MGKIACAVGMVVLLIGAGEPQPPKASVLLREKLLQQAFGEQSEELGRPIRVLVKDKGLVLSTGQFIIEEDGRVKLTPCSIACFSVKPGENPAPPFTTIRSDWVLLTLDRPIQMPSELAGSKIIAVKTAGGLRVKVEEP
jgi:hypothetical protein